MSEALHEQRRRAERIDLLAKQARSGTRAALASTVLLSTLIVPAVGWMAYASWALAMFGSFKLRDSLVAHIVRSGRRAPADENLIAISSVALALVVGFPGGAFMPYMAPDLRGLYTAIQVSWVTVAALIIGMHVRSYRLYVVISYSLLALGWWQVGGWETGGTLSLLLVLSAFILIRLTERLNELFNESLRIREANEDLVQQLTGALEETARAQRARSQFLAAASHDLLQPVHALMLLVGVLRESDSATARIRAAGHIELTAATIASMFRGLLDQARLEAGSIMVHLEPISLASVCRGVEVGYKQRCVDRGLDFSVHCPPEAIVLADAVLLDRVLRNLVDNAFKFTERGAIAITAELQEKIIVVTVTDTGVGVDESDKKHIFDAFYRGARAPSTVDGVGLGLSVAAQMIALMSGHINVDSTVGQGTRVQVTIPRSVLPPLRIAPDHDAHLPLLYHRILVVEDDPVARHALELWLNDRGCEVIGASSMEEAFSLCDRDHFEPQFLLFDFHLGQAPNGLLAIAAARLRYGQIPAALITGDPLANEAVPLNVELLRKPVNPAQLQKLLQNNA